MTAKTDPLIEPERTVNECGVRHPPTINEIKFQIMKQEGKEQVMKPKELPLDKLTAISHIQMRPYFHLLRTVVIPEIRTFHKKFMLQTIQFRDKASPNFPSHISPVIQQMSNTMVQTAITFTREQLTHLDPPVIQDYNLHPEMFIEYEIVQELIDRVADYKKQLAEAEELNPPEKIFGQIDYQFADGSKRIKV